MSSSINSENTSKSGPKSLGSFEHAGNLTEHLSFSEAESLCEFVKRCQKEGRHIVQGRPQPLPEAPASRVDYFLTLDGVDSVIEHSIPDLVLSVCCGIKISAMQKMLAEKKQCFPISCFDEDMSLLEYINSGNSGPLEHGYGEARDLVLGIQALLASGDMIKCGGRVVKNVTGYDLPKLFCGAQGTLCLPFSAHLRLFALPESSSTLIFQFSNAGKAFSCARKLCRSGIPISCLELLDSRLLQYADDVELKKLLPDQGLLLCVQIQGIASVVADLEREVRQVSMTAESIIKAGPEDETLLWKFLSSLSQSGMRKSASKRSSKRLDIAAPIRVLEKVVSRSQEENERFQSMSRPGRYKASIFHDSEDKEIIEMLSEIANESKAKMSVAYSDECYLYKVRSLPEDDQVLVELKHRLKHEFDGGAVFNPLALP